DSFVHLAVTGAAAKIAAEGAADLIFRWVGVGRKKRFDRHDETGGAIATLRATPVAVSFLNRRQTAVLTDAFDSGDLLPFATGSEHRAGEHGDAIDENSARAAGGVVASALMASELQILSQSVE